MSDTAVLSIPSSRSTWLDSISILPVIIIAGMIAARISTGRYIYPEYPILGAGEVAIVLICFNSTWHFIRLFPFFSGIARIEWREELAISLVSARELLIEQIKPVFKCLAWVTGLNLVFLLLINGLFSPLILIATTAFAWAMAFHGLIVMCRLKRLTTFSYFALYSICGLIFFLLGPLLGSAIVWWFYAVVESGEHLGQGEEAWIHGLVIIVYITPAMALHLIYCLIWLASRWVKLCREYLVTE